MSEHEQKIIKTMTTSGGEFGYHLGTLFSLADDHDRDQLKKVFDQYFRHYEIKTRKNETCLC